MPPCTDKQLEVQVVHRHEATACADNDGRASRVEFHGGDHAHLWWEVKAPRFALRTQVNTEAWYNTTHTNTHTQTHTHVSLGAPRHNRFSRHVRMDAPPLRGAQEHRVVRRVHVPQHHDLAFVIEPQLRDQRHR